jgi:beta-galactosidase/beta-glucuronidase
MDENREFGPEQDFYQNMADLVQRDRNHPSVTVWSFCNEGACGAGSWFAEAGAGFRNVSYFFDGSRPTLVSTSFHIECTVASAGCLRRGNISQQRHISEERHIPCGSIG